MSRHPGETTEQWYTRATIEYQDACEALETASTRLHLDRWRWSPRHPHPPMDAAYQSALDNLDLADDERTDATIALGRERDGANDTVPLRSAPSVTRKW